MRTVHPGEAAGVSAPSSAAGTRGGVAVPCLSVRTEPLLVNTGGPLAARYHEVEAAVLDLSFDYDGQCVRPDDPAEAPEAAGAGPARDLAAEQRARYLLESFGAVEIACLDDHSTCPGSTAQYLVRVEADVHALCSFSAYVLPQLAALGWRIEVARDYPWQVVAPEAPWYAHLESDEGNGWLTLELGVEVEGRRVNLLPALLALIDDLPASARWTTDPPINAPARGFALPVGERRYVTLPPERVRILLRVLRELYQPSDPAGPVRLPQTRATLLGQIDAAFTGDERTRLGWTGATAAHERGRSLSGAPDDAAAPPSGFPATLRPYQQAGVAWLQHLRANGAGGLLADDMGLGKTLQTIAHLVTEKQAGRLGVPALVVAPTSVAGNWRRELARFAPGLKVQMVTGPDRRYAWLGAARADVVVTSYPVLVRDQAIAASRRFSVAVLDEAQAIKNPRSLTHQAARALEADQRLCLSGTPVENNLGELWALVEFVMPGLLGDADWFRHRYAYPIERGRDLDRLRALRELVAPFVLRRTKEQVARDLPPKTEIVRPVELRGAQRDLYEGLRIAAHADVRRAIAQKGIAASAITILDALMKLRQVCCDPRLVRGDLARDVSGSAKYDLLMEVLRQQLDAGRRVLVFSQFASMLDLIGRGLDERGIRFAQLTGRTLDRQRPIDDFQRGRAHVFLISLKAGGTGLNLTTADTVIHYDPWWNPAAQAQATDRAHRIGQSRPVFVHNLIVAGSVEERILALQAKKRALADGLLGPTGAPSTFSGEEIDELFAPIG